MSNTFHKKERLCSKKQIDLLFAKGLSKSAYPVKLISLEGINSGKQEIKVMFVVPKKKFKNATDRNKLKRRMREAYRLEKGSFYMAAGITNLNLAFLYYGNKSEDYLTIAKAIKKLLTPIQP